MQSENASPSSEVFEARTEARLNGIDLRLNDHSSDYARLEILLAALGLLLALLIVYLGWRVENSAVKAATQKAKDELGNAEDEIKGYVAAAKDTLGEARKVLRDIEGHKAMSSQHLESIERVKSSISQANRKK